MKRLIVASASLAVALSSRSSVVRAQSARPAPVPPPAEQCVAPQIAQSAAACPRAAMATSARQSAPPPNVRATPARSAPQPAFSPDPAMRAPGRQRLVSQSIDLLQREIALNEALVRSTPATQPAHATALLRLSEVLIEYATLSNAQLRALDEPLHRARQQQNRAQITELEAQQQQWQRRVAAAQREQIAALEQFVAQHASHPQLDQALFNLGFTLQSARQSERALQAYQLLLQRCPQSTYVPFAFFEFGEHYFDRGEMEAASSFYGRALQSMSGDHPRRGYTLYRLAWTAFNQRQFDGSLQRFTEAIEHARTHPDDRSSAAIARTARSEMVLAYGALYGVSRPLVASSAFETLRRYSEEPAQAVELTERLAELYRDNGQWPNAIAIYHELMARQSDSDRFCQWQAMVARATIAQNQRGAIDRELQRLLDVHAQFRGPSSRRPAEAQSACRDHTARVLFDTASHWHLEAIGQSADGTAQTRGTRDPHTMQRVSALYEALLDRVGELEQVTFPDYDRRDWPTRARIAFFRAEILRAQGDFGACGPAFDRVVELEPSGALAEDAAYKSVLCYNDLFARSTPRATRIQESAALAQRTFNEREQGMYNAFTRYVCVASATLRATRGDGDPAQQEARTTLLTIAYRRAYLAYSANQFEQAATLFRPIALASSDDPTRAAPDPENLREIAADLYLDSLSALGRRPEAARPACFDRMEEELPQLRQAFCSDAARAQHEAFCQRVDLLGCQLGRQKAEALGRAGRFHDSAVATIRLLRERAECRDRADLRADEMLFNAALMYDAARELSASMRVRERLVELYLPQSSPWAQRALYRLAGNYHAIQVFGRAAETYERYAEYVFNNRVSAQRADPNAIEQAASSLRQATLFRVALGDEDKALSDAQAFARALGGEPRFRRQAASVLFSIGQIYQDRARRASDDRALAPNERRSRSRAAWSEVVRHYTAWVNRYAREGTLDQQLLGQVALGRALTALDDEPNAQRYLRAAVQSWGEDSQGEQRVREQLASEGQSAIDEAIEKARDAVAEARFGLAELVYQRFLRTRVPQLRGASTARAFDAWTRDELRPYIQAQRTRLRDEASPMFETVMRSGVPHWQIAAGARLADMFIRFANIIRETPFPPDWNHPGEPYDTLRDQWRLRLDEETQPLVDLAKTGYQQCLQRATRARWFNEWSQLCERNLNEIDRAGFPLAEELRVSASLIYSRASNARFVWSPEHDNEL